MLNSGLRVSFLQPQHLRLQSIAPTILDLVEFIYPPSKMAQTAVDQIFEPPIDYEQLAQAVQNEIALR